MIAAPYRNAPPARALSLSLAICAALLLAAICGVASAAASPSKVFRISNVGDTPGVDYTQEASSSPIDLTGDSITVIVEKGFYCSNVPALPSGQVYTLVSTTGGLSGAYEGVPDGTEIDFVIEGHDCGHFAARLRINYHETGEAQTVTGTVVEGSSIPVSSTQIALSPEPLVTNEPATITATVETSSGTPEGSVAFSRGGGTPIAGCSEQPIVAVGSLFQATCETSFKYSTFSPPEFLAPATLSVEFTPTNPLEVRGSSNVTTTSVRRGPTTTSVAASSVTPTVGSTVTYTATVADAYGGPALPSGSVEFLDAGLPIAACESQTLTAGSSSSSATCATSYSATGEHAITAVYAGDDDFLTSTSSPALAVTVQPESHERPGRHHHPRCHSRRCRAHWFVHRHRRLHPRR